MKNQLLALVCTLMLSPLSASAQKSIYIPSGWSYNSSTKEYYQDGYYYSLSRKRESDNFVVFWTSEYGTTAPDELPTSDFYYVNVNDLLQKAEGFYQLYAETLKFVDPEKSTTMSKYKCMIMLQHSDVWAAYGGGYDFVVPALWINPQTCKPVGHTIAHEVGHSFHYMCFAEGNDHRNSNSVNTGFHLACGNGQAIWEQTAQWQANQSYPELMFDQSIGVFRKSHNYAYSHEWHRYQSYWLHYYLCQHYNDIPNIDANGTDWIPGNAIHWAGSLEINPFNNKQAWVTSGNGIFMTEDVSAKVPLWKFMSKGIEETVPLDIVSIPGGPLVTAIGDYDGAVYTDIKQSAQRHKPTIGTTESMGYAPLTGSLVRTGVITVYGKYDSQNFNVMYRSDDMGKTWDSVKTTLKGPKGLVVLSADGKIMLHRPDQGATVYRSDDNGASWTAVETGTQTNYSRIVADPVDPKTFYVMGGMGSLYRSTDGGKTFAESEARLQNEQAGEYYNGGGLIRTVPKREGHLWVPMDQAQVWQPKGFTEYGLAYTEDGGKSWNRCEGASTAIAVGIGKAKEGADYETIFIWGAAKSGDPIGIYRSTDFCF